MAINQEDLVRDAKERFFSSCARVAEPSEGKKNIETFIVSFKKNHARLTDKNSLNFYASKVLNEFTAISRDLQEPYLEIVSMTELLLADNSDLTGFGDTKEVVLKHLSTSLNSYNLILNRFISWNLFSINEDNRWTVIYFSIASILILVDLILVYFLLFLPSNLSKEEAIENHKEVLLINKKLKKENAQLQMQLAEFQIKNAKQESDIKKLKESISISLSNIAFQKSIKERLYLQVASEIKAPVKVLKRQLQLMRSIPGFNKFSEIVVFSNAVQRINNFVSKYYALSRGSEDKKLPENIFFDQLVNEIGFELQGDSNSRFIVEEPQLIVKTEYDELKIVLTPFMKVLLDITPELIHVKSMKEGNLLFIRFKVKGGLLKNLLNKLSRSLAGVVHEDLSDLMNAKLILEKRQGRFTLEEADGYQTLVISWPL